MSDFLATKKDEIQARLDELAPAVKEYNQLTAAIDALNGNTPKPKATGAKRGRPTGTGTRSAEAIAVITAENGLTASEIAERMGINQNYLYRVLPALEQDGKIEKRGRGWYPADGLAVVAPAEDDEDASESEKPTVQAKRASVRAKRVKAVAKAADAE